MTLAAEMALPGLERLAAALDCAAALTPLLDAGHCPDHLSSLEPF